MTTVDVVDVSTARTAAAVSTAVGALVGVDVAVPVLGGGTVRAVDLDAAATSPASAAVAAAVADALPHTSSVHRGTGWKSQVTSARYEAAREAVLAFAGADPATHTAVFGRNTTEALNTLAFRLRLDRATSTVVVTGAEHHANILPWRRHAALEVVGVDGAGTFTPDDVAAALDAVAARGRPAAVLAVTGASNVTGWLPDVAAIGAVAARRGVLLVLDAAQLAPHRPLGMGAWGVGALALSGHKMYAPFGAGALVAPRALLADGEPMLVGGGAVDAVSFDEVLWTSGPDREEAGSPNTLGAIALGAAAGELSGMWPELIEHEASITAALDEEVASVPGLVRYGPVDGPRLPVATFDLPGLPHALVAARLSHEHGIAVRSGCFCAHPLLTRLLGLDEAAVAAFHADVAAGRRGAVPGLVRASAGRGTTVDDVRRLGAALRAIVASPGAMERYAVDDHGQWAPREAVITA